MSKQPPFKATHSLPFEVANHPIHGALFRIGTCEGIWGSTEDCYYILSIVNKDPGNGHLNDVFEWFENSCRRDNKNLIMLECINSDFAVHLVMKRGFCMMARSINVIKIFNKEAYDQLKATGNTMIRPKTLTCY
jgi:hypothetical protein